jgi:hypothetical protein
MYVRGKYGKSLKLDKLKETTPAAKDNLNTIGNSRSTPKEKAIKGDKTVKDGKLLAVKKQKLSCGKDKRLRHLSEGQFRPFDPSLNPFGAYPSGDQMGGLLMVPPTPDTRIKELLQQMQTQQAVLDHSERFKELEKQLGPDQAKLLIPFLEAHAAAEMMGQLSPEEDPSAMAAAVAAAREMMASSGSRASSPFAAKIGSDRRFSEEVDITSDIEVNDEDDDSDVAVVAEVSDADGPADKEVPAKQARLESPADIVEDKSESCREKADQESKAAADLPNLVQPSKILI